MENGTILDEFINCAKVHQQSSLLPGMVPITSSDEICFLCSNLLFAKCIALFQEASEKLAIDRVKKGKKPAALELQLQKSSSNKDQSGPPGKKKGKGK